VDVNKYLEKHAAFTRIGTRRLTPRLFCADGFNMSVQVSSCHYCTPRTEEGPYHKVEVGYPSEPVPEFEAYCDGDNDVYGYVPVEIVDSVIAAHGGIALEVTP
jgi:hypothetical protein